MLEKLYEKRAAGDTALEVCGRSDLVKIIDLLRLPMHELWGVAQAAAFCHVATSGCQRSASSG